ncbi:MAG: PEP-CTERM sorting domain-containing protein [Planctomycetota bacterium]|nr:MAG: PEP-CTERM sorting domain-containing protein [Planctomycetota bacterium]
MKLRAAVLLIACLSWVSPATAALDLVFTFDTGAGGPWNQTQMDVVNFAVAEWEAAFAEYDLVGQVDFGIDLRNEGGAAGIAYGWVWGGVPGNGEDTRPWQGTGHYIGIHPTALWWDPTPETDNDVPGGVYDALTVVRHELAHMLGFTGGLYFDDWNGPNFRDVWLDQISGGVFDPGGLNVPMTGANSEHTIGGLMDTFIGLGSRHDIDLTMDMLAVAYDLQPVGAPVDLPSNASFDSASDVDVLNLDFGTVGWNSSAADLAVDISNLINAGVGVTEELDLTGIVGSGDTATLSTDIAPFVDLAAGSTNNFLASIDTAGMGTFSASYDLSFTDDLGTNQTLTLNLSGAVENMDDPTKPDLYYNPATGEVHLDPRDSNGIIGYVLQSNDEFTGANHTPILVGGVATSLDGEVSEATLTPLTTPGSIGLVFPTGLDFAGIAAMLTTNEVSTALGAPVTSFDFDYTCGAGDVNCDGFVDVSNDILPAFSQFTGPGSFSLLRENGDVNGANGLGDDDVDVTDLLDILSNFTGPPPDEAGFGAPAEAGDPAIPDLIYDPTTGEVVLDFDGSSIIGYSLQNATNSFLPAGHTPILAGVATALTSQLEEAALAPGSGSIGFVFPTGLDLAGLQALLSVNQVSRFLGAPLVPFDLVVLSSGPVVPEPSTFVLWTVALGTLGLVAARRRRS